MERKQYDAEFKAQAERMCEHSAVAFPGHGHSSDVDLIICDKSQRMKSSNPNSTSHESSRILGGARKGKPPVVD